MIIKEIEVKDIMTKTNLPVSDYAVNPYVGCTHACKYCYTSFMKRFTNHPEPWGEFVDVKRWTALSASSADWKPCGSSMRQACCISGMTTSIAPPSVNLLWSATTSIMRK